MTDADVQWAFKQAHLKTVDTLFQGGETAPTLWVQIDLVGAHLGQPSQSLRHPAFCIQPEQIRELIFGLQQALESLPDPGSPYSSPPGQVQ